MRRAQFWHFKQVVWSIWPLVLSVLIRWVFLGDGSLSSFVANSVLNKLRSSRNRFCSAVAQLVTEHPFCNESLKSNQEISDLLWEANAPEQVRETRV